MSYNQCGCIYYLETALHGFSEVGILMLFENTPCDFVTNFRDVRDGWKGQSLLFVFKQIEVDSLGPKIVQGEA